MTKHSGESDYQPINWQNHGRQLTREEFYQIAGKVSAVHFAKEAFADQPWTMQLLYCAEALMRDREASLADNPFPESETEL